MSVSRCYANNPDHTVQCVWKIGTGKGFPYLNCAKHFTSAVPFTTFMMEDYCVGEQFWGRTVKESVLDSGEARTLLP